MTFNYFAYGSNMLTERLKKRCPSTTKIGLAYVDDRVIEFSKRSKDCSGKATLRWRPGDRTPGVLFRISRKELEKLDSCEGAGRGYDRYDQFPVYRTENDEIVRAKTYIASYPTRPTLKPYDWYLALVIAGVLKQCLGANHLTMLRSVSYCPDTDRGRKERREAIQVLAEAGFPDYHSLLSST